MPKLTGVGNTQYAPELNEENFPSLSSAQTASPQPKISRRGFADAIKSLAGPNTKSCTSKSEEAPKGSEGARAAGGAQGSPIEWKDTGRPPANETEEPLHCHGLLQSPCLRKLTKDSSTVRSVCLFANAVKRGFPR